MICPRCSLYISDPEARECPRCGEPQRGTPDWTQGNYQYPADPSLPSYDPSHASSADAWSGEGYTPPIFGQNSPSSFSGYGSQWAPPGSTGAASPTWAPPVAPAPAQPPRRQPSRARRALLYGGISVGLLALAIGLCVGCSLLIGFEQAKLTASIPTATPFPGTTPGATIIFQDALTSNINRWADDSHCFFQDNSYHIKDSYLCYAPAGNIGDAQITVQAKQVAGSLLVGYGIAFRHTSTGNFYEFEISGNSAWRFAKFINGTFTEIVQSTANAAIKGGLNTVNTLSVSIKGTHFEFFVNGTKVGEATDSTFSTGLAGLRVGNDGAEVAYNNFQITAVS